MKSLALHLSVFLLLGSLHNAYNNLLPSVASATSRSSAVTTTTTLQPPSLSKPQRHPSLRATTTAMTISTTKSPISPTSPVANVRRRKLTARRAPTQADQNVAVAASTKDAATFTSTRLVRNANVTLGNVRQNRSFLSSDASASASSQRSDSNAVVSNGNNNKMNKLHRRLSSFGPKQYSSTSTAATAPASVSTTTTSTTRSSSLSSEQQSLMPNHHRRSKQHQMQPQQQQQQQSPADSEDSSKHQRTTKTPRMIHRLVAGHLQNAEVRSRHQVSSVTTNSSVTSSINSTANTTPNTSSIYFRRKPLMSSSYRQSKFSSSQKSAESTTTLAPVSKQILENTADDQHDDEALLDDPGDFDNWDHGILRSSAGAGKENTHKSNKKQEDAKKTLSDQVRDGKYGLIEKELFRREPKRPGILSYLPNKEVPVDNERNYGGLDEEDIWLAEDHLLVIKGGSLNEGELNEPWPPIDDYDEPGRQIKLPPNPKVPPPFPVQLEENGPLQFIGNNKFTVIYPVTNESLPVYPAGLETNYASSESDDEKNLLTRPGSSQSPAEDEPSYLYPTPPPPWLYHNQTFVNTFLSNPRPITFPGLGPFPFGRNGSLEGSNGTDYFDEDDPSLYYPPAYSFVYKSNYSNPVPPGPLVPGIVLPPPPNQFSRLEKPGSKLTINVSHPPSRHRIYTTSTSTTTPPTTTTTTTTSTTTELPYRHVVTKIAEYTPKIITITSAPPVQTPSSISSPKQTVIRKKPTSPPVTEPAAIEPVPVPVAVPVPIYPAKHFAAGRPNHVSFVSVVTPEPAVETFSKSNPIYYEYVEPKRQPSTANDIDDFTSTTAKPAAFSPKPIKIYANSKRPFKHFPANHRNYLQPIPPQRQYVQENVVYITPKPEIRPYYRAPIQEQQQQAVSKERPVGNFEREVNVIRQTLRLYQNQQLRDNNIPRTPKAKPVYEYSYNAEKNSEVPETRIFQPPAEYDDEPFKPMVTYSPPVNDENSFRAIAYDKTDREDQSIGPNQKTHHQRRKYPSTTTLIPVQPSVPYEGRPKKIRLGSAKYLEELPQANVDYQHQKRYPDNYQSTPRTILSTQSPWISLDKQVLNEYEQHDEVEQSLPQQQQQKHHQYDRLEPLESPDDVIAPRNRGFPGYYYGPPPGRQNNRFYDEPFHDPVRKIINNYRPPIQPQYHQPQRPTIWSLENDTYVNYAPNRPPLDPDAEFINPYDTIPLSPYENQNQRFPQQAPSPPPALSHQYYGPPQRFPLRQQQQQPAIPLHRDILVNYRQPLPAVNPDSEYIAHPQGGRQSVGSIYRPNSYRLSLPSAESQPAVEPPNVFYITPKYRRGSSSNSNSNNNHNNNNDDDDNRH